MSDEIKYEEGEGLQPGEVPVSDTLTTAETVELTEWCGGSRVQAFLPWLKINGVTLSQLRVIDTTLLRTALDELFSVTALQKGVFLGVVKALQSEGATHVDDSTLFHEEMAAKRAKELGITETRKNQAFDVYCEALRESRPSQKQSAREYIAVAEPLFAQWYASLCAKGDRGESLIASDSYFLRRCAKWLWHKKSQKQFDNVYVSCIPAGFGETELCRLLKSQIVADRVQHNYGVAMAEFLSKKKDMEANGECTAALRTIELKLPIEIKSVRYWQKRSGASAYVCFKHPSHAQAAIDALHNYKFTDEDLAHIEKRRSGVMTAAAYSGSEEKEKKSERKPLFVCRAKSKSERLAYISHERVRDLPDPLANVFVSNLPPYFGDVNLREVFGEFGAIVSVKVVRKYERCNGYVQYANVAAANSAIWTMDGSMALGGSKPLRVARFERREPFRRHSIRPPSMRWEVDHFSQFNAATGHKQLAAGTPMHSLPSVHSASSKQVVGSAVMDESKRDIGEHLLPKVQKVLGPRLAARVTKLLLQKDETELLKLLDSSSLFLEAISEATLAITGD